MKKILSVILGLVAMTSLYAANTEVARLTLTGQGGVENSYITLRVDPTVTTAQTGAFFQNTDLDGNVNLYIVQNSDKYSSFKKDDLTNLPLEVITNRRAAANQHYTITFNVPTSTVGLKLKDLKTGDNVDIVNNTSYEFDVNTTLHPDYVEGTNYVISGRFVINYTTVSVKGTGTWYDQGYDVDLAIAADGQTATGTIDFSGKEGEWYNFKVVRGSDWLSDANGFDRSNNSRAITTTETDNMWFEIEDGTVNYVYTFTWTFATNTLEITYPTQAPTCAEVRNGLNVDQYYTICLPKAVESANGASFWNMTNRGDGVAYLVEAELPLVAGRPYIFQAEATELCVVYSGEDAVAGTFGALHGTFAAMDQAALDLAGSDIYLLKNNELWLVSGQTGNSLAANRAYIKYGDLVYSTPSPAPGRRVRAIPMQDQSTTGVENLNAAEAPVKTVIDGKMYILRGEHMFDATGRMVK